MLREEIRNRRAYIGDSIRISDILGRKQFHPRLLATASALRSEKGRRSLHSTPHDRSVVEFFAYLGKSTAEANVNKRGISLLRRETLKRANKLE